MRRRSMMVLALVLGLQPLVQAAPKVSLEIWQAGKEADRRKLVDVAEGAVIDDAVLPRSGINLWARVNVRHDAISMDGTSSDGYRGKWGPEKMEPRPSGFYHFLRADDGFFPTVGTYAITTTASLAGKVVAETTVHFTIVHQPIPPHGTHYLAGRVDYKGNAITSSTPVYLPPINETPKLRDYDYPFEPQHALYTINFERFPPFAMNPRFQVVWDTQRFSDEPNYGGPDSRGFNLVCQTAPEDNRPISHRAFFDYPGSLEGHSRELVAKDPIKYRDLLGWVQYRSAWVSPANAEELGWLCYDSAAWQGNRDFAVYGWDEEEMWWTRADGIFRDHPDLLPDDLRKLHDQDPKAEKPETIAAAEASYMAAWSEFLGNFYKGARACAASRGRRIKVFHYGSLPPGMIFANWVDPKTCFDAATGTYSFERLDFLFPWYKRDGRVDFTASGFPREVDYFNRDFYYQTVFPEKTSIYERGADGKYVLAAAGRRKIRRDEVDEAVYATPTRLGYEDYEAGPAFLRNFVAIAESDLYWVNGGKYYKDSGTLVGPMRFIPTMRPGDQETWGESAKLGSRPVSPYLAEAAVVYAFVVGADGMFLWDENRPVTTAGQAAKPDVRAMSFGDVEFMIKGLHRLSRFGKLFDGKYSFVRPERCHDMFNRDHPIVRGIINGRYLLLAMTNPYLDFGETQDVDIWYGGRYEDRAKTWHDKVTLLPRRTHLFQCKLPAGKSYDPDKLYFRYTQKDGAWEKTYTVSGNYTAP